MKRPSEPWKPPAWLEPAFIYIAFSVAVVAASALVLWVLITFVVPFNVYSRETDKIILSNGQTLLVKYPNLVLAGDTPAYITLILYGESNVAEPATFTVEIPLGLTVVEPVNQAQGKTVTLTATNLSSATEPVQMKIGVVNSRSVDGLLLFIRRPMIIESSFMPEKQNIEIGIEKIPWMSARGIVNNTINEKSTLILLVTGFLSGAGTLVLQNIKTHRDRTREDQQKKEERFYKLLQEDFEGAINVFLRNRRDAQSQDDTNFNMYKALVEQSNWYHKLSVNVLENLKKKETVEAERIAKILIELCDIFGLKDEDRFSLQSLYEICNLALVSDRQNKALLVEDANSLLTAYKHWQALSSIVTDLIQDFSSSPGNLILLHNVLQKDEVGRTLLESSNLQHVIGEWRLEPFSESDRKVLKIVREEIAHSLHWRPLWASGERRLSEKVQRWLSRHWYE